MPFFRELLLMCALWYEYSSEVSPDTCCRVRSTSYTTQHFLNGIGTEQVKINIIELMAVFAFVTFGPFLSTRIVPTLLRLTAGTR